MSFLNPEKLPVSVYRWDDENAPKLDRAANCVSTIFKACLVTGYGTKSGAGWSMPFEDTVAGVKVLRPPVSAEQDFYLRLSADNGSELTAQVYTVMSNINTGDLKLQCNTAFKYATAEITGKWLLIATNRGFWFFNEQYFNQAYTFARINKAGTHFYCGDSCKNVRGDKLLCLMHTGGSNKDVFYELTYQDINRPNQYDLTPVFYNPATALVSTINPKLFFDARLTNTDEINLANCYLYINKMLYLLAGIYTSSTGNLHKNFDEVSLLIDGEDANFIAIATGNVVDNNFFIRTDYWVF